MCCHAQPLQYVRTTFREDQVKDDKEEAARLELTSLFIAFYKILRHADFCETDGNTFPETWREHFQGMVDVTYKAAQKLHKLEGDQFANSQRD